MDPGTAIIASSVIGAGSSLAGGFLGGKGTSAQKMATINKKHQRRILERSPSWIREGARRAGFHPLAPLGS